MLNEENTLQMVRKLLHVGPRIINSPVFDLADEQLGRVSEYNEAEEYIIVHRGWMSPQDLFVPIQGIGTIDSSGIYLNVYKDELKRLGWEHRPTQSYAVSNA